MVLGLGEMLRGDVRRGENEARKGKEREIGESSALGAGARRG